MAKINKSGVVKQIKGLPTKASIMGLDGYAKGGLLAAGGDDVPAQIEGEDGALTPAALKEGEFVFSVEAITGAGNGDYDRGLDLITQLHDQLRQRGMGQDGNQVR